MSGQNTQETLSGTVMFQQANAGSKSESMQPYLRIDDDTSVHLFMEGTNPFEHSELHAYDGRNARVTGTMRDDTFVVRSIEEIR